MVMQTLTWRFRTTDRGIGRRLTELGRGVRTQLVQLWNANPRGSFARELQCLDIVAEMGCTPPAYGWRVAPDLQVTWDQPPVNLTGASVLPSATPPAPAGDRIPADPERAAPTPWVRPGTRSVGWG
ncbi:MAG: hypothetical protein QOF51_893 [Chloroflexota bacterium]|jgi:hypothetical protein|nr:hypothetical protein [Chloroflexota bacterium]